MRVTTRGEGGHDTTSYGFEAGGHGVGSTTALVSSITQPGQNFTYTYDNVGNITSVNTQRATIIRTEYQKYEVFDGQGNKVYGDAALTQPVFGQVADTANEEWKITYQYDKLGQLVRVNDPYDKTAGAGATTWVYSYDWGGNITSKAMYFYTTGALGTPLHTFTYTYDATWKDKLISLKIDGFPVDITYDSIGNPQTDGTWNYAWQAGRQMKSMARLEDNNGIEVAYAYNADGLRVRKTVNGINNGVVVDSMMTEYILHGKQVVHVKRGDENLHFFYDAKGRPAVVQWGGMKYGYVHNLQGDIVAIIDGSGNAVVEYTYDAWGSPLTKTGALAATLGTLNPFRYRGYVYDDETGLYYLRSRYYHPMWGRFLNADNVNQQSSEIGDYNLFAYCLNKCVSYYDVDGDHGQKIVGGWRYPGLSEQTQMELLSAGFALPVDPTFVSETQKGNKKTVVLSEMNRSLTTNLLNSPTIWSYTPPSITTYTYTYRIERRLNLRDSYESARQNQDWKAFEFAVGEMHPLLNFLIWAVYSELDAIAKFLPHTPDPNRLYYEKISEDVVTKFLDE